MRYAVDLARSPDGQWWVLSDRSQAPSGAGYSLENRVVGSQLLLPSVATWWCGQPQEMDYVLENLESLVIKQAFPGLRRQPVLGGSLSPAERNALRDRIRDNPSEFVGQEQVRLSTTPVWEQGAFEPRPLVLRAFVVVGDAGVVVMPGGLTRVAPSRDDSLVSSRTGGARKGTWVLGDPGHPDPPASLPRARRRSARVPIEAGEVASRVADNLFWLGRYAVRV